MIQFRVYVHQTHFVQFQLVKQNTQFSTKKLIVKFMYQSKLISFNQIFCSVYQLITSKIGSIVRGQSLMIVINSYPMGWKV
jgi:hypothetical protein